MGFSIDCLIPSEITSLFDGKAENAQSGKSNPLEMVKTVADMIGSFTDSGASGAGGASGANGQAGGVECLFDLEKLMPPATRASLELALKLGYAPESKGAASSVGSSGGASASAAASSTAPTYAQQWANALNQLKAHFDLLDTASGIGGKDGIIGRCDLEAALANPNLPKELKDACKFLLDNPAAFNQLETAAGVGECDGFVGKCDVDAALAALPASAPASGKPLPVRTPPSTKPVLSKVPEKLVVAQQESANETSDSGAKKPTGKTPPKGDIDLVDDSEVIKPPKPSKTDKSKTAEEVKAKDDEEEEVEEETSFTFPSGGASSSCSAASSNPFDGMSPEEIVEALMMQIMGNLDDQIVDKAKKLHDAQERLTASDKGSKSEKTATRDVTRLEYELQKLVARRSSMFNLVSNMQNVNHEMAKTAIGNLGRI